MMICSEFPPTRSCAVAIKERIGKAMSICRSSLLGVLLLTACLAVDGGSGAQAASFLERAQEYMGTGDLRSARIELKNALQRDPSDAEARFLLGKVELGLNNPEAAEKELVRAGELGNNSEELELLLARARLELRQFEKVAGSVPDDLVIDSDIQRDLFVARGEALLNLGRFDEAEAIFDRVLLDRPHIHALTNKARISMALGNMDVARGYLDQAIAVDPDDPVTLAVDGSWYFRSQRFEEAKERFAHAVQKDPNRLILRFTLVQCHLALRELDQAAAILESLKSVGVDSVLLVLQDSIVKFLGGNYREAKSAADQVLAVDKYQAQALLVSAYSAYRLGDYEQARTRLSGYLSQIPSDDRARAVLGATMLRLGKGKETYAVIGAPPGSMPEDTSYLAALAESAFAAGDRQAGLKYLERLAEKQPDNSVVQEKLGVARVSFGDVVGGAEALERAVALDPGRLQPYLWLFRIWMEQENLHAARQLAKAAQSNFPKLAAGDTMLGFVSLSQGEVNQAKELFLSAIKREPSNPDAANNLASILYNEGELGKARSILQGVLDSDPTELRTLLASAEIERMAGNHNESEALLLQAVNHHPTAAGPRAIIATRWLEAGRPADALQIIEPVLQENKTSPQVLKVAGLARQRTGDESGGLELFQDLVKLTPNSWEAEALLMEALERNGRFVEALEAADRTLNLAPKKAPAEFARVRYLAQLGRIGEAKKSLQALRSEFPDNVELLSTEGRIALKERRPQDAFGIFEQAYEQQPDNVRLVDLARVGVGLGESDRYLALMNSWIDDHPYDLWVRLKLSEMLIVLNKLPDAKRQYEFILEQLPENAQVLNNLSWVQLQLGEADAAVEVGRKAVQLAPHNPDYKDTLAVALLAMGEEVEALELLKSAVQSNPESPDIRFHLARAFVANDDQESAATTLQSLLESDTPFRYRGEAQALLDSLKP